MAAAAGYTVVISAKDAASPVFGLVNKNMAALNKRIEAAHAPFKRFGDEMNRFAEVTGIAQIATGFRSFGIAAGEAWRSVSRVVEPLAAITSAASVAGIIRLTEAWADFGQALGNQAIRANVSADSLYNLQNAARLAGVDAGALTSSMTALADNMRNAGIGAAPDFLNMLRAIHVNFRDLQAMKPEEQLRTNADGINRFGSPTDRSVWTRLGFGSEGLTPLLRYGSDGIAQLEQQARRLAGLFTDEDARRASQLQTAVAGLGLSVTGVGNAVASAVAPVLVPLLNEFPRGFQITERTSRISSCGSPSPFRTGPRPAAPTSCSRV